MNKEMQDIQLTAQLIQRESTKAYEQGVKDTLKNMQEKLHLSYTKSLATYEELELKTFDKDYDEDYSDTVTRLYEQGFSDALLIAIKLMKGDIK